MNEIIEIPFGAKDSELCEWEYTIPEGYTASIENGKIIVKKEENEDERAKKEITELVMQPTWKTEKEFHRRKELCAWLEKQDEQKSAWSEEDELHIRELESLVKQVWATAEHEDDKYTIHRMSDLSFFLKTLKPQPKQEWSEEDKTALCDALWCCKQAASIAKDENDMGNIWYAEKWLKSLKDRVQPQWKPSEEQILALEYQVHSTYEGSWQYKASKELLEQLKKL